MTYYKIVLSGENIFFENDSDAPEPVIGFITCKLINAETEDLAVATAKRDLLVHWNHSFNSDRKLGMPKLAIEFIEPVKGWFKPKPVTIITGLPVQNISRSNSINLPRPPVAGFGAGTKRPGHILHREMRLNNYLAIGNRRFLFNINQGKQCCT